ncbi:putative reverse transcriptase domain-containing protein [Tanacetum coccineum]
MENKLWNLRVKETDISSYTTRFNELVLLCPGMVPTEQKKMEAYIRGLRSKQEQREKLITRKGSRRTSKEAVVVVVEITIVTTGANAQPIVTCYGCGEKGHIKANCPAKNNPGERPH